MLFVVVVVVVVVLLLFLSFFVVLAFNYSSISILYMPTMCLIIFFVILINIKSNGAIRQSKKLIYFRVLNI
jgi:hypothetical protein